MLIVYGIKNCDTVKKARAWLDGQGIAYTFHDYKTAGIDRPRLQAWSREVGWERLVNKAGTTFRKLPDADKADLNERSALALMETHTSLIKRPIVEGAGALLVGFNADEWSAQIPRR